MTVAVSPRAYHLIAASRRAPHRVAQALIDRIRSGVYAPGSWLPKETALLQEFPVSRPALREALTILQCLGLIDVRRSLGMKVLCGEQATNALSEARIDLVTLLEACCLFEVESTALAAGLASATEFHAPSARRFGLEAVHGFHTALAQTTGNGAILACVANLWDALLARPAMSELFVLALRSAHGELSRLQALIIQAVVESDPRAARAAVKTLFSLYLTRVLDTEEQERMRRVHDDSQQRRSIWGSRLRADARSVSGGGGLSSP